jgi:hypothetical protein
MIDHFKRSPVDCSRRERLPEDRDPSLRLLAILVGVVGVMAVVSAL